MTNSHITNQTLNAQEIVRQIDEIIYEATTNRPLTGWDEDENQPLREDGMKVADIISYVIYKAKAEALYDAAKKILGTPAFVEDIAQKHVIILDLIEQSREMLEQ